MKRKKDGYSGKLRLIAAPSRTCYLSSELLVRINEDCMFSSAPLGLQFQEFSHLDKGESGAELRRAQHHFQHFREGHGLGLFAQTDNY